MPDDDAMPQWLRGERRPPTVEALLGAVGGLVALAGASALYGEVPDDDARAAGVALAMLTLLVGLVLPVLQRSRALEAAGVALSAGAVVPLAFLVATDPEGVDSRVDFLVVSVLAVVIWLVLYGFGPARGHGAFLGLALFSLWLGALAQTGPEELVLPFGTTGVVERSITPTPFQGVPIEPPVFDAPFGTIPPPTFRPAPTFPPFPSFPTTATTAVEQSLGAPTLASSVRDHEGEPSEPSRPPVAPAVVSMLFGLAYLAAAFVADGARLRRVASAFLVVGITASAVGVILSGPRLGAVAASSLGLVFSVAVLAMGVAARRRLVAWLGAGSAAFALATGIGSIFGDSAGGAAVCLLVVGIAVIGLGMASAEREEAVP